MNELVVFGLQLGIAFSMSLFVLYLLNPFLKGVLLDTCGTDHSSAFWLRFTQLMMVIAPLVIVIFFANFDSHPFVLNNLAYVLKQTILLTLIGEFLGLLIVGRVIYRAINLTVEIEREDAKQTRLAPNLVEPG